MAAPALLEWIRSFQERLTAPQSSPVSSSSAVAAFASTFKGFSHKDPASVERLTLRITQCDACPLGDLLLRVARDVCGVPQGALGEDDGVACLNDSTRPFFLLCELAGCSFEVSTHVLKLV